MAKRDAYSWTLSHSDRTVTLACPIYKCVAPSGAERVYDTSKLAEPILQMWMDHGRSKLHDAMALERGNYPGGTIPESAKLGAMDGVFETLLSGEWNAKRETLSPEQKFIVLRGRVSAAWESLEPGRDSAAFEKLISEKLSNLRKLGNSGVTENVVIESLAKHPKIIAAMALLSATKTAVDVEDLV